MNEKTRLELPLIIALTNTDKNRNIRFVPYRENFTVEINPGDTITLSIRTAEQGLYYLLQANKELGLDAEIFYGSSDGDCDFGGSSEDIAGLLSEVKSIGSKANQNTNDITSLKTKDASQDSKLNELQQAINQLNVKVTAIDINTLNTKISNLEKSVLANSNSINEIKSDYVKKSELIYSSLTQKPRINGVELDGDKSTSDLGITTTNIDDTSTSKESTWSSSKINTQLTTVSDSIATSIEENKQVVFLTQQEYNQLPTKDPNKLYSITDKRLLVDSIAEASDETTFTSNFIKNTFSQGESTFVISSNQDFADWAANKSGNDYSIVYISAGTYTLASGSVNLDTTNTKAVIGHPQSKLIFQETTLTIVNGVNIYVPGLFRNAKRTSSEYYMRNVTVEVTGAAATSANSFAVGFYNCCNLTYCSATAVSTGTKTFQAAYGFCYCDNISFCQGKSSGANNGNAYGFAYCNYMSNCIADMTSFPHLYDNEADIYCFVSCSQCTSCYGIAKNGYELLRGFFKSNNISSCYISLTQDNGNTKLQKSACFEECYRINACEGYITNSGTAASASGTVDFYRCSGVVNCKAYAGMKNCNKCSQNNSPSYISCWADGANTIAVADTSDGGFNSGNVSYPSA